MSFQANTKSIHKKNGPSNQSPNMFEDIWTETNFHCSLKIHIILSADHLIVLLYFWAVYGVLYDENKASAENVK